MGVLLVDGSKFQADNSKDNNFTINKLDDRIKWFNAHTDEYLRILKEMDEQEELEEVPEKLTREVIEGKLKEAQEGLARYEAYQKLMEEIGESQTSLTDADARLMKNKNGFVVAYNPQTAVDSETHLIRDFKITNQVTNHGMLSPTMEGIRKGNPEKILEVAADKGYEQQQIPVTSKMAGSTVQDINIRQRYGLNIIAIEREHTADTRFRRSTVWEGTILSW